MSGISKFFKKLAGDQIADSPLVKQPIADADAKLTLFRDVSGISSNGFENYIKSITKSSLDENLKEKLNECKLEFVKYEKKGDEIIETTDTILLNNVINKTIELQNIIANEMAEYAKNLEKTVLKSLDSYQKEVGIVKENRRELKDAYTKQESCRLNLEKAKRDVESSRKQIEQSRIQNDLKKQHEAYKALNSAEEKTHKYERELDDARLSVNEKYDRYTEGLYKRVSEETDLSKLFLDFLKQQQKYHLSVCQNLEETIPEIEETINNYPKKPIFGVDIQEHLRVSISINPNGVSPVIRKLIESMIEQNAFEEEGIFRIGGSKAKMNRLISAINSGYLDYIDFKEYDVHCLASVLKQYLRDLPDSIMCNDLYNDWINATNSNSKIESYKQVLKKLPKPNYENLKYIVKFLSLIIDNSDKTKMNSNNIGICFGMSLLSSTVNNEQLSTKNIDMGTASNAFDFMLSNNIELFPGEINFSQFLPKSNSKSIKQQELAIEQPPPIHMRQNRSSSDMPNTPEITNRHSVMVTDRKYLNNEHNSESRGHSKKPSADFRIIEESSPSPENISTTPTIGASPRLKSKKQAPAPPPTTNSNTNNSSSSSNNTSNGNSFPKIQTSSTNDINIIGESNNSSSSNSSIASNSNGNITKLKSVESTSSTLEKPIIPPPIVPTRPPPIGFNISLNDSVNQTANDVSPTSTLNRPPKPAIKPKPSINVLAQVMSNQSSQKQQHNDIETNNETGLVTNNNVEETNRLSSEITSL